MRVTKLRGPRPRLRRAVLLFPSGLTLFNLFFGVFAIITASRGDFRKAGIYVLLGGICDALDGRVARATNAGSQFGEELDSLVDAISFGLAPAMIMYFAVLNRDGWDWVFTFLFVACAVMRLARFNIEQAGTAKTYFQGLPSPAAGCTLASYYWFSQSWLYNYGAVGNLPWQELLRFLMAGLAGLMISNIPYPTFPRTGFRSLRSIGASVLVLGSIALLLSKRLEYFFPLTLAYVLWGIGRWSFSSLFERRQPTVPYDLSEDDVEDYDAEEEEFEPGSSQVHTSRQRHRDEPGVREDRTRRPRPRADAPDTVPKTEERAVRPERGERPERPERPHRTEAERAARREKRDKREGRSERAPRPPRPELTGDTGSAPANEVAAPADVLERSPAPLADAEVIGSISEAVKTTGAPPPADGAPARKRKRRRRRGERKERGPAGAPGSESSGAGDTHGRDAGDGGDDDDSPYESPTPMTPPPAPTPSVEPHE